MSREAEPKSSNLPGAPKLARRRLVTVLLLASVVAGALVFLIMTRRSVGSQAATDTLAACPVCPVASRRATQTTAPTIYPPGTIDGAKHPELIPDDVAYKMLFLSLLEPTDARLVQPARQEAKMRMIGLSADDKAALLVALSEFQKRLSDLGAQSDEILKAAPNPAPDSAEQQELSDIEEQTNTVVIDTVEVLRTQLSLDGFAKLEARLVAFKATIKAFPMPGGFVSLLRTGRGSLVPGPRYGHPLLSSGRLCSDEWPPVHVRSVRPLLIGREALCLQGCTS